MSRWLLVLGLLALTGCKKDPVPAESSEEEEGPKKSKGQSTAVPSLKNGHLQLTADKLEQYVKYQQTLLTVYPDLVKWSAGDGGQAGREITLDSTQAVQKQAEAQDRARKASGLSQDEINEIERMVGDVVNRRMVGNQDAALAQLEELAKKVPEAHRAQYAKAIEETKKKNEEAKHLTEERARYGDANVDLILTREAELEKNWNGIMAAFFGTARDVEKLQQKEPPKAHPKPEEKPQAP